MCGLVGWLSKNQSVSTERVKNYVVDQYEDQQSRGTKGYGLLEIKEDGYIDVKRATTEAKMLLDAYMSKVRHLLLHHRSPTSTENFIDQTHPIEVEHDELKHLWYVMHNGCIHNANELKKKHEALGYVYLTENKVQYTNYVGSKFNDSESLAIELARFIEEVGEEGKPPVMNTRGGFAFIAVAANKKGKIQKVYLGTNGYGGLNLADNGQGYYFASEEKTGESIPKDTIIQFNAKYQTAMLPGGEPGEDLVGFEMVKEPIKIEYFVEPEKPAIVSPYSKDYEDHARYGRAMGFGYGKNTNYHLPKERSDTTAKDIDEDEKGNINFSSYAHIITYLMRGKLGEVFQDTSKAIHPAIEEFPLEEFNKNISNGKPEESEDMYNKYIEDIGQWLDVGVALTETLEPVAAQIPKNPTATDIVEGYKEVVKKRMSAIARDYLPLFWLASYCECAIDLAYQYQADQAGKAIKLIDTADPDKTLDRQMNKDIEKIFPSKKTEPVPHQDEYAKTVLDNLSKKEKEYLGEPIEEDAEIIGHIRHNAWDYNGVLKDKLIEEGKSHEKPQKIETKYLSNPKDDMDNDAGAMLSSLAEQADEMYPEELYHEAEEVGNTIRTAAEMAVIEQLGIITALASEEGVAIKIPFHFTKIKDEMEKTRRRFETLAHIVKATQVKEGREEWEGANRNSGIYE